jgi:pimeloyl-ACP methyl ester carboxylesterase
MSIDGAELAFVDSGAKPPLLLVHGFPLDAAIWRHQLLAFGDERRVLAPDLVGFGASSAEGRPSIDAHADDLAALLDGLGIARAIVCGHSMGGYVALAFQRRYPERTAGLVLACTRAEPDDEAARAGRRDAAAKVLAEGLAPLTAAMLPKLLAAGADPDLRLELEAILLRQPPSGAAAALLAMAGRADAVPGLADIDVPSLVITGAEDILIPPSASKSMAAAIPAAGLTLVPNAGHMAMLEEPGAFNAALRAFVSSIDAG